jgi:hypothetical protein
MHHVSLRPHGCAVRKQLRVVPGAARLARAVDAFSTMRASGVVLAIVALGCGRAGLLDEGRDAGRLGSGGGVAAGGSAGGATAGGSTAGGTAGGQAGGTAGGQAGGTAGGTATPCVGLSVSACRADSRCTPDFCFQCSCEPRYAQCRLKTAAAFECPQFGCPQPNCCSDDSTCGRPFLCLRAEQQASCGICNNLPSTCTNDLSCGAGTVCLPRRCACSGETDCQPGCGPNNPCPRGQSCDASTRRCEDLRCSAAVPCPSGTDCILGPAGTVCLPRACTSDAQCGDVFCVSGSCAPSLGICGALPP